MNIEIVPVSQAYADDVSEHIHKLALFQGIPEHYECTTEKMETLLARQIFTGFVGLDNDDEGKVVGISLVNVRAQSSFSGSYSLYLQDLYVSSDYRNQNIGERLLRAVARDANNQGVDLYLSVLDSNQRAIDFYMRLGATYIRTDSPGFANKDWQVLFYGKEALSTLSQQSFN